MLEAKNQQNHICGVKLHTQAAQIRAIHPSDGSAFQVSERNAPWAKNDIQTADFVCEEESAVEHIHNTGSGHKR